MLEGGEQGRWDPDPVNGQHRSRPGRDLRRRCGRTRREPALPVGRRIRPGDQFTERLGHGADRVGRQPVDRGQEGPLVLVGLEGGGIEEHGRAPPAAFALEGQGDEVPERAFRHEVLGGEEPVVTGQVELGSGGHRLPQEMDADPSGRGSGNRTGEEHPHMGAVTGAGAFERRRDPGGPGGVEIGQRVQHPAGTIEIAGQQTAGVTREQRVEAGVDLAGEVGLGYLIGKGQILTVGPSGVGPPTSHRRPPAALPRPAVLPPQRVHVLPASEEGPEQCHLRRRRRRPVHRRLRVPSGGLRREQRGRPPRLGEITCSGIQPEQAAEPGVLGPERLEFGEEFGTGRRIVDDQDLAPLPEQGVGRDSAHARYEGASYTGYPWQPPRTIPSWTAS